MPLKGQFALEVNFWHYLLTDAKEPIDG